MNKKVVVLGGGTGMSTLLKGLKEFPIDITAVVSVCDDGSSTGRLRKEFNTPAVGDIRRVLVSLSESGPLVEELFNYRFKTTSDLDGHTIGNLLLTAMINITGNMSEATESIGKILNLRGKILPLSNDNLTLVGQMNDDSIIKGEHNITSCRKVIKKVYYDKCVNVNPDVIKAIEESDLIILSMGSLFTSIIPNLICSNLIKALDKSKSKIMYICNMVTQPGETDNYKVSDHVKTLNNYLGKHKVDILIANNGEISKEIAKRYYTLEQKDPVIYDPENLENLVEEYYAEDFVYIDENMLRYKSVSLALKIFTYLI